MGIQVQRFYRTLLKIMMQSFQNDYVMFHQSRLQARKKIMENQHLTDPVQIAQHIQYGNQAIEFLKHGLIQGTLQQDGKYRFKIKKQHIKNN